MILDRKYFVFLLIMSLLVVLPGMATSAEVGGFIAEENYAVLEDTDNEQVRAVVSVRQLRLRSEPSIDSEIITQVAGGTRFDVMYRLEEWIRVYFNGYIGYLNKEFVRIYYGEFDMNALAEQIIAHGKQFLGTPYVWGGNDLRRGVDCSGFVHHVFREFGIILYRNSSAMTGNGVLVGRGELEPGDLVFFDTAFNGGISHVGLYIGAGEFIHAASPGRNSGVIISSLYEDYYIRTYRTARRVLQ